MADLTSSSLTIAATPAEILKVIADVHAYPEWNGEIKRVEVLATQQDGLPSQARFTISSTGMTDEYTLDYVWLADGVSWRLVAPSTLQKSQVGSYRLVPVGGGTEVRYDLKIDAKIPMIGPMRRKIEKRIVDGALKELKERVESLG
ncbi:MAG TPA: SRPBCC family protein [Mycobacteriales bacterium]|nr:SRPBCC family protein [Mycobacteriales bacterium]